MNQLPHGVQISARLLPAICVAGAWLSVDPLPNAKWRWYVDLPNGQSFDSDDLGARGTSAVALESLASFMSACGESVNYGRRTGHCGENAQLFPPALADWCADNAGELSLAALELEELNREGIA